VITVSRSVLKRFRTLCRRGGLYKSRRGNGPIVTFVGADDGLRIRCRSLDVAVEYRQAHGGDAATIRLPLAVLDGCAGTDDSPVTFELLAEGNVRLSWGDGGVPRQTEVAQSPESPDEFPETSPILVPNEAGLWPALRDAVATTAESSSRYALACLQLRGAAGTIEATDGRQVLVQSGYHFGWDDDLLIPASKLLGCRDLVGVVSVGRTGDWVVFGVAAWSVWLQVQKEARYPKLDQILPNPAFAKSRLELSSGDARFLGETLPRLPCDDLVHDPVTLDLNGEVLVRARECGQARPTEICLTASRLVGEPVMLNTNRRYVERALRLGFDQVCLFGPNSPALCVDERRQYLWALLDKDSAIKRNATAVRIDSSQVANPHCREHVVRTRVVA